MSKKKKFPDNAKNPDENHKCMRKKLRHPSVSFTRTCLPDTLDGAQPKKRIQNWERIIECAEREGYNRYSHDLLSTILHL